MLRFCWIALLLIFPATALGQTPPVQPCPSDSLDASFQAVETADHSYTLAINLRNISAERCWVSNYPGGTGMDFHAAPGGMGITICYYCDSDSQRPAQAQITLDPGESAHQTRSWKTAPADGAAKCGYVTQMNWDEVGEPYGRFQLFSPSLLKPICSAVVVVTNYSTGRLRSDTLGALTPGSRGPIISWANDAIAPYSRERIPLRVAVEDPNHLLSLGEHSCPRMFLRARDATPGRVITSRWTRVEELQDVACRAEAEGAIKRFIIDFDASYALNRKDNENKGEYTLDVSSLAEIDGRYLLLGATQALHLSMVDGKFIRRDWGPVIHGVAVSLNLDKNIYTLGSDIPLHIALENSDSQQPISAMDPYYDPPGVAVELQDVTGQPVAVGEGAPWTGHRSCHRFSPGLVFPIELKLSQMGFRPDHAGVYTVVAVWRPMQGDCGVGAPVTIQSRDAALTVKSLPVSFRVVENAPAPAITGTDTRKAQ
jgi:hypothetical protein